MVDLEISSIPVAQTWRRGEQGCREGVGTPPVPPSQQLSLSPHPLLGSLAALVAIHNNKINTTTSGRIS